MEVVAVSTTSESAWPSSHVVSNEELVRRAGAKPFTSLSDLHGADPFMDDAEYAAFLADLYAKRRAGVA